MSGVEGLELRENDGCKTWRGEERGVERWTEDGGCVTLYCYEHCRSTRLARHVQKPSPSR